MKPGRPGKGERPGGAGSRNRAKRRSIFLSGGIALIAAGAVAAWWWPGNPSGGVDPDDPELVKLGGAVYAAACAACHGARLEGQPDWRRRNPDGRLPAPPHDESGHTWHHSDEVIYLLTKKGMAPPLAPEGYESDMPGFEGRLADREIRAVLAYIKSTWPRKARQYQDRINRQSER